MGTRLGLAGGDGGPGKNWGSIIEGGGGTDRFSATSNIELPVSEQVAALQSQACFVDNVVVASFSYTLICLTQKKCYFEMGLVTTFFLCTLFGGPPTRLCTLDLCARIVDVGPLHTEFGCR